MAFDFKKLGDMAVDAAPAIAGVLAATGVGVPVAGAVAALGALGRAFGLGDNAKPEEIEAAIKADPQAALKLRLAEMDFTLRNRELDIQELREHLQDVQNARDMDTKKTQATGKRDYNLYILAWVNVLGFFAVIVAVILADMPTSEVAKTAVAMLFGALIGGYKDVLGYFFGSSKSSSDKTALLANGHNKK